MLNRSATQMQLSVNYKMVRLPHYADSDGTIG
jgi:hypothetical protein